jgi:hypothetical protein
MVLSIDFDSHGHIVTPRTPDFESSPTKPDSKSLKPMYRVNKLGLVMECSSASLLRL